MAFTKKEKTQMIEQYESWLTRSQAVFMLEYAKMSMKEIDGVRVKVREAGGEMHVVKNSLFSIALDQLGWDGKDYLDKTTIIGFAFSDAPALAKVISDAGKSDVFTVKGGLLARRVITAADVKALADLPPLPVIRAQLLGVFNAPASKLVRTINEPGRGLASVIRAHAEKEGAPEGGASEGGAPEGEPVAA